MKTETELLPCPFCGNTNLDYDGLSVECGQCGTMGPDNTCKANTDRIAAWNRRPLPAPQPGGGGEAPGERCPTCQHTARGNVFCSDAFHFLNSAPTPPIALPVRAEENGWDRLNAAEWITAKSDVTGEYETFVRYDFAKEITATAAALSRELEESREGRADFINLLATTLGVETGRQDYIVMHIQSLRSELEEAKAEVARLIPLAYETRPGLDIPSVTWAEHSQEVLRKLYAVTDELTALRAAPRSEGPTDDQIKAALVADVQQWDKRKPASIENLRLLFDHYGAPRSETEGRDKALRETAAAMLETFSEDAVRRFYNATAEAFDEHNNRRAREGHATVQSLKKGFKEAREALSAALGHDEKGAGE